MLSRYVEGGIDNVSYIWGVNVLMTMCLIFGKETIRVICVYAPQIVKPNV